MEFQRKVKPSTEAVEEATAATTDPARGQGARQVVHWCSRQGRQDQWLACPARTGRPRQVGYTGATKGCDNMSTETVYYGPKLRRRTQRLGKIRQFVCLSYRVEHIIHYSIYTIISITLAKVPSVGHQLCNGHCCWPKLKLGMYIFS